MALRITFLGTGGAFTDFRLNYHNNALVHTRAGPVLIDCGGTAPQALRELHCPADALRAVVITHLHGDHVGGLEQLVWERFYAGEGGPSWLDTAVVADPRVLADVRQVLEPQITWFTRRDLTVGHDGYDTLIRPHALACGHGHHADGAACLSLGGVQFSLHATPHVSDPAGGGKPCTGVRVQDSDGASLYFTSDTELRADIGERFPSDVIFHDCTFSEPYPGTVHTHYQQLVGLPDPVRRRTVLMHHTRVPDAADPVADGFAAAAERFDTFEVTSGARVRRVGKGLQPSAWQPDQA